MKIRKKILFVVLLLAGVFVSGCGPNFWGENPPQTDTTPPTVSLTIPANLETGVPINRNILVSFSELMDASTINDTTITLKQGAAAVAGVVTHVGYVATFNPTADLATNTTYTATVTTGVKDLAGNAMAVNKVWSFTTGTGTDTTPPTVSSTIPIDTAIGVTINSDITASFSEAIEPTTITTTTFTLKQGATAVAGVVTHVGYVATFNPTADLATNTTYTATVTTGVKDLAGNAMAVNKVWSFTTGTGTDTTPPTVSSTVPIDTATGVTINSDITASFSEAIEPTTITTTTFLLKKGSALVDGAVTYSGSIATFNPTVDLAFDTTYEATITTGVTDLAGNHLAVNKVWTFTTKPELAPGAAPLGLAGTFGIMGWSGLTSADILAGTIIYGDVAVHGSAGSMTGFPPGVVTGTIYTDNSAPLVEADLLSAYNFAKGRTPDTGLYVVGTVDLGGVTMPGYAMGHLPPGVYSSGSTMNINTDVVLDGGGNPDAVWVFQIYSSLTTTSGNVTMGGLGQAKNVFWVPTAAATLGVGTTFNGNILAGGSVTCSGNNTVYGRILGGALGAGAISLDGAGSTVHVPLP